MTNTELKQIAVELVGEAELARRFRVWITGIIKKERIKRSNMTSDEFFLAEATEILEDLNKRTGSRFTLNDNTKHLIRCRMGEGYVVPDFYKVHEVKCVKWLDDPKMQDNLRPSTLYRPSHFSEYHAEWYAWDRKKTEKLDSGLRRNDSSAKPAPSAQPGQSFEDATAQKELIAKLMAKGWSEFETWADLIRWTMQFPDAKSLEKYSMPERIRKMRTAPSMVMNVLKGQSPEWAEAEYKQIKKEAKR